MAHGIQWHLRGELGQKPATVPPKQAPPLGTIIFAEKNGYVKMDNYLFHLGCSHGELESVSRRSNGAGTSVEDMSVDHGRLEIAVTEEFLDGPDVVTTFKEVGREGMPERVAGNPLGGTRSQDRLMDGPLEDGLVHVVATLLERRGVGPTTILGKNPLPGPVSGGAGVFLG